VPADVAVGAQSAVLVADDEHRLIAGVGGDVAAGRGQRRDVPGELPGALEDQSLLDLEQRRIGVEPGLECDPGRGGRDRCGGGWRRGFDWTSISSLLGDQLMYRTARVKRSVWLSITPEPEAELPAAVATLRSGTPASEPEVT